MFVFCCLLLCGLLFSYPSLFLSGDLNAMASLGAVVIITLVLLGIWWVIENVRLKNQDDFNDDQNNKEK
jgi:ABC-type branched-subunit amino acid transport system permease subunit